MSTLVADPNYDYAYYLPMRSSPLSERHSNMLPLSSPIPMSKTPSCIFSPSPSFDKTKPPRTPVSKRAYKAHPFSSPPTHSSQSHNPRQIENARRQRADMFLRKVQERSEARRWDGRADLMLRKEYLNEMRSWEREREMAGMAAMVEVDDDEMITEKMDEADDVDVAVLSSVLLQEEQDLQALIDSMQQQEQEQEQEQRKLQGYEPPQPHQDEMMSCFDSDDEEYDQLFQEVMTHTLPPPPPSLSATQNILPSHTDGSNQVQDENMDMDMMTC
ncbi:MAG: hypothetical protein M1834_009104 [Cirrosporium novae-zelandiae]|nr:MAG: hypothetical protein M1834_009104 [Cirrosporium novae-zelandiae]